MKVLLVQCPCSYGVATPPLGLAYLCAFLKENNYDVSVLDLSIDLYESVDEENKQYWKNNRSYCWYLEEEFKRLPFLDEDCYNAVVEKILSSGSDILGFSIQNTSAMFTREIIKRIKSISPSKKIILGGPNCYNLSGDDNTFKLHHNLHEYADMVVIGEGEKILLNLLSLIESGRPLDGCRGVAFKKKNGWAFNGFAEPIINLDELPFPDFAAYNMSLYKDKNALPILTSRGCAMRCVFCTDTYFWRLYRYRSPENVIAEIIQRRQVYKNNFFSFNDSLINGSHINLMRLCDLLIKKKLNICWGGNCRVDKRLNLNSLKKMKKAGCEYLILGIESASDKILRLMGKRFTIETAERFINDCHRAGVGVTANWIAGFPGETEDDFKKTEDFIIRHRDQIGKNTFSALTINQFSYLERHKEDFGITLDGPHLGLWRSANGENTIELRNYRLRHLENLEAQTRQNYDIVRQVSDG